MRLKEGTHYSLKSKDPNFKIHIFMELNGVFRGALLDVQQWTIGYGLWNSDGTCSSFQMYGISNCGSPSNYDILLEEETKEEPKETPAETVPAPQICLHPKFVNISFLHIKMVCAICGKDQEECFPTKEVTFGDEEYIL